MNILCLPKFFWQADRSSLYNFDMRKKAKKGFTLIELIIIVAIIGLVAAGILAAWGVSSQRKAAVSAYKSSMNSLQTAMELCTGTGGTVFSGVSGTPMCGGSERYPELPKKCGSSVSFVVSPNPAMESSWSITTSTDCYGCRLVCDVASCSAVETAAGDC